jgi:hypothetical protein
VDEVKLKQYSEEEKEKFLDDCLTLLKKKKVVSRRADLKVGDEIEIADINPRFIVKAIHKKAGSVTLECLIWHPSERSITYRERKKKNVVPRG